MFLLWLLLLGCIAASPYVASLNDPGDFLIRNTVRLSLLYWTAAVVLMLRRHPGARFAWTLACAAYLVHVGVSFEHAHHWSHGAAFQHVKDASGYGEGIFVSYFFTLLWTVDVCWWWLAPDSYETRRRWLGWAIHGFMVFIIINGTVFFESGAIRWIGAGVLVGLACVFALERSQSALRD